MCGRRPDARPGPKARVHTANQPFLLDIFLAEGGPCISVSNHRAAQVATSCMDLGHFPAEPVNSNDFDADRSVIHQLDQVCARLDTTGLAQFGGVDAIQPDPDTVGDDRIPIDDKGVMPVEGGPPPATQKKDQEDRHDDGYPEPG